MELMKKHKLHILLPVILVVLAVVAGLLYNNLQGSTSSNRHCQLGQQYLNKLDYAAAVLEFTNAITLDPTNQEARVGLAQAYSASGNQTMAQTVLMDVMQEDKLDSEICDALLDVYKEGKDPASAVQLLTQLIHQTDEEIYYDQLEKLIMELCEIPRNFGQGIDHKIRLKDGKVLVTGSSKLGQLGGADPQKAANGFTDAVFPGTAARVYATENTSFVVDTEKNLWAAGENRWGQLGLSYGDLQIQQGWQKLTDTKDVACVAGSAGMLMVMKTDGSLWLSGAGIGQSLHRWTISGTVIQIQAAKDSLYVLTGESELYRGNWNGSELQWTLQGKDVAYFCASGDVLTWIGRNGNVRFYSGVYEPSGWEYADNGYCIPSFSPKAIASNGSSAFFLTHSGQLMEVRNSTVSEITTTSPVTDVYTTDYSAVAVLADGTMLLWERYDDQYTILD